MDTRQIEYILQIAEENNITKAAEKLFITQSALNQQLLKLEKELGTPLFHRSRTNWRLTEAGEIYIEGAKAALQIKNTTYNRIYDVVSARKGHLTIGLTPGRGLRMFTSIYPELHRSFPNLDVRPIEMRVRAQQDAIAKGDIDVGLMTLTQKDQTSDTYYPLKQEELVLIIPSGHANPLCATLAKEGLGIELTWVGWFWAAVVPAMICFFVMPLLSYKILNPELKRTPEAKKMGREELKHMGPMSSQEIKVAIGFVLALLGWGTTMWTGLNANAIGIGLAALLFAMGAVNWKDVLADKAAWDTVVWFGVIISLATGLTSLGFIKWMSAGFASMLTGMDWMTTFILLGFAYIYLHYVFATASGHVAAMYVPFAAVAIGAGAPPLMVAVCFAIFSNFMWGITEYAGGPGPIYFGQGFFERPRFYKINFVLVTASVIIVFAVGMLWWKIIGLY